MEGLINFYKSNKKMVDLIAIIVVACLIVASLAVAFFIGGEFASDDEDEDVGVVGSILVSDATYETVYEIGDTFIFSAEGATLTLLVLAPTGEYDDDGKEITEFTRIDDLASTEYGFQENGEGIIYPNASDIMISEITETVTLTSYTWEDVKYEIKISIPSLTETDGGDTV